MAFKFCWLGICLLTIGTANAQNSQSIAQLEQADKVQNSRERITFLLSTKDLQTDSNDSIKAAYYQKLGNAYAQAYSNDTALNHLNQSLQLVGSKPFYLLKGEIYNSMGNTSLTLSATDEAMKYYNAGLEELGDLTTVEAASLKSRLLGNIGGIYNELEQYSKSLEYAQASFQVIEEYKLADRYFFGHLILAFAHSALGNLDQSMEHNLKVLDIILENGDSSYLAYAYKNIASIYHQKQDWKQATKFYLNAKDVAWAVQEYEVYVSCFSNLAEVAEQQGQFKTGIAYAEQGIDAAKKYGLLPKHIEAIKFYYSLLKKSNQTALALSAHEEYMALKDSLFRLETVAQIEEIESKYEKAEQQKEIALLVAQQELTESELSRKQQVQFFLVGASTLAIVILVLIIYNQRQKARLRHEILEGQLNEYRIRLNEMLGKYEGDFSVSLEELNDRLSTPISEREYDVLKMVFTQKTNQEIADELFLSINTVKSHLKNLYDKLGVNNRGEVVKFIASRR
ncbi:MAG: LuxR C-terminal-related transcriptional regulator [Imperialibacter sp.]|uniref:LuxR C-terminal-related transcriptional regulator n=1 Tax=Imperialibacter sp. TaxID=2038411 RepID=UPI003A84395E